MTMTSQISQLAKQIIDECRLDNRRNSNILKFANSILALVDDKSNDEDFFGPVDAAPRSYRQINPFDTTSSESSDDDLYENQNQSRFNQLSSQQNIFRRSPPPFSSRSPRPPAFSSPFSSPTLRDRFPYRH